MGLKLGLRRGLLYAANGQFYCHVRNAVAFVNRSGVFAYQLRYCPSVGVKRIYGCSDCGYFHCEFDREMPLSQHKKQRS